MGEGIGGLNTGTLPFAWANLEQLQTLDLSNNKLSGSLPKQWEGMRSLQRLYLSGNNLEGIVPATWHNGTGGMASLSDAYVPFLLSLDESFRRRGEVSGKPGGGKEKGEEGKRRRRRET